jgi:uncharacterized protein (TIGR02996 family)
VLAAPENDQALQVLADALMERNDPHGELIRLQLAGDEEGSNAHLAKHAATLLGMPELATWSARFARGFLSSLRLETASEFEALMKRPISRLLREVRVPSQAVLGMETDPIERLVEVLATHGPRTITSLKIGLETVELAEGVAKIAPLTDRFTSLDSLEVSWQADFEEATSSSLRHLRLNLWPSVSRFGDARFPALSSLELELPYRVLPLSTELLAGTVSPKLDTLTVRGTVWPQLLHELSGSTLLRNLRRLEISAGSETAWYPALIETASSFAHLEQLGIAADRNHPEWISAVKTALPHARILSAPHRFFIP